MDSVSALIASLQTASPTEVLATAIHSLTLAALGAGPYSSQ
jgi:hypothetical protein